MNRLLLALGLSAAVAITGPIGCESDADGAGGPDGAAGAGGEGGAGGTDGGGGAGGTVDPPRGVTLTFRGTGFIDHTRDHVGAVAVDEEGTAVASASTTIAADGKFEVSFDVEAGGSYVVRYFADRNRNGTCDGVAGGDGVWLASVGLVADDLAAGAIYGVGSVENTAADACDGLPLPGATD